jgi:Tfp pilus assembly protein PilN
MLRSNLATRPFYNERLVRGVLVVALAAAVAWAAVNAAQLVSLSQQGTMLGDRARTEGLRAQLRAVSGAASEANALIQRRTFSWTGLFNQLETTLPPDVRLVEIQPQTDDRGRLMLSLTVVSKQIEDLDTFIRALEGTGAFLGVVSRSDEALDDGTIESNVQGYYKPAAAGTAPAASEPMTASPPPAATEVRR